MNILELDLPSLHEVSCVMVLKVDMLRAIVEYWVFRKSDTPLVVRINYHWSSQRNTETMKKTDHPYRFF